MNRLLLRDLLFFLLPLCGVALAALALVVMALWLAGGTR